METTEKSKIKFKKSQLANYTPITGPGKYELEVSSNVSEKNLFTDEKGRSRYITGLKAIPADKLDQLKAVFEGREEVDIEELNGLTMTSATWVNEGDQPELAAKGEKVTVIIGYVEDREGNQVLRVINMQIKAAKKAGKLDLDKFFASAEVATQENTLVHK